MCIRDSTYVIFPFVGLINEQQKIGEKKMNWTEFFRPVGWGWGWGPVRFWIFLNLKCCKFSKIKHLTPVFVTFFCFVLNSLLSFKKNRTKQKAKQKKFKLTLNYLRVPTFSPIANTDLEKLYCVMHCEISGSWFLFCLTVPVVLHWKKTSQNVNLHF